MLSDIHNRLMRAKTRLRTKQKLDAMLREARAALENEQEIGGFTTFADYFFDGLIADWVVQSKVRNALDACSSSLSNVAAALRECQRRLATVEQEIEQAGAERRELLEQA